MKRYIVAFYFFPLLLNAQANQYKKLSLEAAINLATDSSLDAFKAKNLYLSEYWMYRTYKSERLPGISLNMTPISYSNSFIKRYDYINNRDVYKSQQSIYSFANLGIRQNVDWTGGTFYIDTELGYLNNPGASSYQQFNTTPFRVGYSQSLFGYNRFKWEKKIEPLKYEKSKRELLYNLEEIAVQTTGIFFEVALNETILKLAQQNILNADSLYYTGTERYKIGSISHSDLLSLKLNVINAQKGLSNAKYKLQKSKYRLINILHFDNHSEFTIDVPDEVVELEISPFEAIHIAKGNNPVYLEQKQNILIAEQSLDKSVKSARFSADISASIGYNQVSDLLETAYINPRRQDIVSVGLSVPILDWGIGKGKINVAKRNLEAVKISAELAEKIFEQEMLSLLEEFKLHYSQIVLAKESREIANQALNKAKQLFYIGKTDVNTINASISKQIEAELDYITALNNYWINYYRIRKYTLFDFSTKQSISVNFENMYRY